MEIDKAIAHIEYGLEMERCGNECVVPVKSAELALTALRQMQDGNKGCEYCNPGNLVYYYAGNVPNYCKHCGRKLGSGE